MGGIFQAEQIFLEISKRQTLPFFAHDKKGVLKHQALKTSSILSKKTVT